MPAVAAAAGVADTDAAKVSEVNAAAQLAFTFFNVSEALVVGAQPAPVQLTK
jgi:hypothetical protein